MPSSRDFHTEIPPDVASTVFEAVHEAEARYIEAGGDVPARLIVIAEPAEGGWLVHFRLSYTTAA